ncbi:MAG: hypothetical protein R3229_05935 [Alphaproteobacteria bacterium]|nr:hypothetical protein [Alphaproteobacteria bacterium]
MTESQGKPPAPGRGTGESDRREARRARAARALRANLRRRKAQARGRTAPDGAVADDPPAEG